MIYGRAPVGITAHLRGLSGRARGVMLCIICRWRWDDLECHPGVDALADETGHSRRSIQTALRELEAAGLIDTTPGRGRGHATIIRPGIGALDSALIGGEKALHTAPITKEKALCGDVKGALQGAKRRSTQRPDKRGIKEKEEGGARMAQKAGAEPVLTMPTRTGADWPLTADRLAEYAQAYPVLDVLAELRRARLWLIDNPGRRKTTGGMSRFVGGWLKRAGGDHAGGNGRHPNHKSDSGLVECRPCDLNDPRLKNLYPDPPTPEGRA